MCFTYLLSEKFVKHRHCTLSRSNVPIEKRRKKSYKIQNGIFLTRDWKSEIGMNRHTHTHSMGKAAWEKYAAHGSHWNWHIIGYSNGYVQWLWIVKTAFKTLAKYTKIKKEKIKNPSVWFMTDTRLNFFKMWEFWVKTLGCNELVSTTSILMYARSVLLSCGGFEKIVSEKNFFLNSFFRGFHVSCNRTEKI